jgi:hypothetical protein
MRWSPFGHRPGFAGPSLLSSDHHPGALTFGLSKAIGLHRAITGWSPVAQNYALMRSFRLVVVSIDFPRRRSKRIFNVH